MIFQTPPPCPCNCVFVFQTPGSACAPGTAHSHPILLPVPVFSLPVGRAAGVCAHDSCPPTGVSLCPLVNTVLFFHCPGAIPCPCRHPVCNPFLSSNTIPPPPLVAVSVAPCNAHNTSPGRADSFSKWLFAVSLRRRRWLCLPCTRAVAVGFSGHQLSMTSVGQASPAGSIL